MLSKVSGLLKPNFSTFKTLKNPNLNKIFNFTFATTKIQTIDRNDLLSKLSNSTGSIENVDTVIVGFTDVYGRLLGKRMSKEFFLKSVLEDGTHGCNYLLTCDMEMTPQEGFDYSNWTRGYGDFHLTPVLSWLDSTGIVICDVNDPVSHELVSVAPRSILKKQLTNALNMGYYVNAASELEYYLYKNTYENARKRQYKNLTPMGDYMEDYHILQGTRTEWINQEFRRHLQQSGIPVECTKGEAGIGQHELNIEYGNVLDMCDKHVLYKQCLKEIAILNDVSVTFMAKPFTDSTGSGCHIHLSLKDQTFNGKSLFPGNESIGDLNNCSKIFKQFLAGWLKHSSEIFPFYAPTVNSYKRFVSESWAPTKVAWSIDNRSAGFRIVGSGDSLRIELRICGADVNPYLAFAGSLASGLDGIKNELECPEPIRGNMYDQKHLESMPTNFTTAINKFKDSKWCNDTFGEEVVKHYSLFYEKEKQRFEKSVTDWERQRYFEQI